MGILAKINNLLCRATVLAALAAAIIAMPGVARADMKSGVAAYKSGDYKAALREFTKLAESGNANAQFNLAILYLTGRGVDRDLSKAVEWHLRAAAQGLPAAAHGLGVFYYQGMGVKQDYAQALKWFKRAAAKGFADSEFNIGVMYFNKQGVRRDDIEVVKWVTLAAARKFAPAEYRLGQMYEKGVIFTADLSAALHWYRLAEAHGDKNAPAARSRVAKALNLPDRPAVLATKATRSGSSPADSRPFPKPARKPAIPAKVPSPVSENPTTSEKAPVSDKRPADTPPMAAADKPEDKFAVIMPGRKIRPRSIPLTAKLADPPVSPAKATSATPPPAAPEKPVKSGSAPGREWRVQFASFRSVAEAERAWKTLTRRAGDAIGDAAQIVARVDLGDRGVYHRLQAGPLGGRAAAIDLCKRVRSSLPNQGCLPVRVRTP